MLVLEDPNTSLKTHNLIHDHFIKPQTIKTIFPSKTSGKHIISCENGMSYHGDIYYNKKSGYGILYNPDSSINYSGMWKDNKKHGFGVGYYENGVYKGQWFENHHHGQGVYIWKNGDIYEGYWKFDDKSGKGKFIKKDLGVILEGYWKDDKMYGKGQKIDKNGRYEGDFIDSQEHGRGKFYYNTGEKYKGSWDKGQKSGLGFFQYSNHHIEYYGYWTNDMRNGQGVQYYEDAKYVGNFKNNLRHGNGDYIWKNEWVYKGQWDEGKCSGMGKIYKPGGILFFDGFFNNFMRTGKGIQYNNNGKYEGNFKNNKANGFGVYTWKSGVKFEGNWIEGKRNGPGIVYCNDDVVVKIDQWNDDEVVELDPDDKLHHFEGVFFSKSRRNFNKFVRAIRMIAFKGNRKSI
ncbi:hypothetical protein SteCoe_27731 [Stentor coeruleus]|uniref:MORN repeat protein n=1 Tax=Stentor coeruleus TaxID=5963 RepID=A0A1R2B9X9_9CILI|nr:hypothetical protein SteCoe_27731 [Stentor coeruleus]